MSDLPALTPAEAETLLSARRLLFATFPVEKVVLFGSKARGDAGEESDVDVLVITSRRLTRADRHRLGDAVYDLGLKTGVFPSTIVVCAEDWESGRFRVLPLNQEIEEQGVVL